MKTQDKAFGPEKMGKQLRKLRNSIGMSQEEFAEKMNLSKDTVSNYERGRSYIPHDLVIKLCQEFNYSADYFYFEIEKPLIETIKVNCEDMYMAEIAGCTDLEKKQLYEMLKIIRMQPATA